MTKKSVSQPRKPRKPRKSKEEQPPPLDFATLNALVERINHFIASDPSLADATQVEKAKAIGINDQKAFSRLVNKRNALTLQTLDQISTKMQTPSWRLLMPLALDEGLKALGFPLDNIGQKGEPQSKKSAEPTPETSPKVKSA